MLLAIPPEITHAEKMARLDRAKTRLKMIEVSQLNWHISELIQLREELVVKKKHSIIPSIFSNAQNEIDFVTKLINELSMGKKLESIIDENPEINILHSILGSSLYPDVSDFCIRHQCLKEATEIAAVCELTAGISIETINYFATFCSRTSAESATTVKDNISRSSRTSTDIEPPKCDGGV
jgi:hypothetical protein